METVLDVFPEDPVDLDGDDGIFGDQVRHLGRLLGETIRVQESELTFALIEEVRRTTVMSLAKLVCFLVWICCR